MKKDKDTRDSLLAEVRALRASHAHPNVIQFKELLHSPTSLYVVMEMGGILDLYQYTAEQQGGLLPRAGIKLVWVLKPPRLTPRRRDWYCYHKQL